MPPIVEVLDLVECRFGAMGTDVHLLVLDGDDDDLHWAHGEVDRLEAMWSRFLPGSDVARVNAAVGQWVEVSPETVALVGAALDAWHATAGAFDPLLGLAMEAAGYDRSFDLVHRSAAGAARLLSPPARRADDLQVDPAWARVRVAPGRGLDLGGIAKGWTADQLVGQLVERGAAGACANLGGDLAGAGRSPHPDGWHVAVEHDAAAAPTRTIALRDGGVATSTRQRRQWRGPLGDRRHHLLDPRRAAPCASPVVEATAVAGSAARAEVLTKVAFVAPERVDSLLAADEVVLLTSADGGSSLAGDPSRLTVTRP